MAIVLVRRVAGPVARRRQHLTHQQPIGGGRRRQDVDDLPRRVAAAAHFQSALRRRDHPAGQRLRGRRLAHRDLRLPARGQLERRPRRQIHGVRVVGEDVAPRSEPAAAWPAPATTRSRPAPRAAPGILRCRRSAPARYRCRRSAAPRTRRSPTRRVPASRRSVCRTAPWGSSVTAPTGSIVSATPCHPSASARLSGVRACRRCPTTPLPPGWRS